MTSLQETHFEEAIAWLKGMFGFDLVTVGLTDGPTAPLKWTHTIGASRDQIGRIVLSPGRGCGGIVLKTARPMLFTDIDRQIDRREYAGYPTIFAESLRSFCAIPLKQGALAVGVLLCAFRTASRAHDSSYYGLLGAIAGGFCGLSPVTDGIAEALARNDEASRFIRPDVDDLLETPLGPAPPSASDPYKTLSPKEFEVFSLLARGFTNREISQILSMSVKTAETHRSKIYRKLDIETRAQLVSCAIRHQILGL